MLTKTSLLVISCVLATSVFAPVPASAKVSDGVIRIGFITDLSGPYVAVDGVAGVEAIRMAVADMGGVVAGKRIEVLAADHRNDAAVAATQAAALFDNKRIDVLIGGVNTDTSLAMVDVARARRKPFLVVGAGSSAHTNARCSPYTVQYAYDTTSLAKVTGNGVTRAGGKSWYFLTADYPFGLELQNDTAATVKAAGGIVVGAVRHPHETENFSPFVREARASSAQVLGLASGHTALIGAVREADKLGVSKTKTIAGLLVFIDDVHALGPAAAQGMYHADSWYWDRNARTRVWSKRFFAKFARMPSSLHAGDYSAALQYLKAVKATGSDDGDTVMAKLRATSINDMFAQNGRIRGDGLMTHDMYLLRAKGPAQSTGPWDLDEVVGAFRGDDAWSTKAQTGCLSWK